ncbi:O-antigen ligase family protein [Mongoliitalea daihaiensis]|uniref:O-antigen ligase family protein n=1 Tax=Mongoliitalea daihaiensis TaxID=2782006 RepID=UPI001F1BCCAB|nr:O-antigen ligase family protein [Mongoliitalea daihaiensis]UJP64512.1 O-antigen ligase family protein [Mongoliitalea daihaiensis]
MEVSQKKYHYLFAIVALLLAFPFAWMIAKLQLVFIILCVALMVGFFLLVYLLNDPFQGFYLALIFAFFVNGLTRYITTIPLGLGVDFLLVLSLLLAFLSKKKPHFDLLNNGAIWLSIIWLGFTFLELFNPEAPSKEAWFYAVRAVSLYQIFTVLLVLMYLRTKDEILQITHVILFLSVLAAFWGFKQIYIGLDNYEWQWLLEGAIKTHVLRGVLRAFSFLSDSGQFGATMGYAGIMSIILALGPFSLKKKVFFTASFLICIYAMAISGTRGALFVPASAAMAYLVATKNFKSIIAGVIVLGSVFFFLKYTSIGNDNQTLRRMRSALNPEDPSLKVRLENQQKFKAYLKTRPFGGGIGTSGTWGLRFSPNSFLAQTPNDSWYVKIWAETGVVGLYTHILIILFFVYKGYAVIFSLHDPELKQYIMALHSGFIGIAFAAYGNPILGQFPLNLMLYFTWGAIYVAEYLNKQDYAKLKK